MKIITKEEAQNFCGKKLDGRSNYFIWMNQVCTHEAATFPCGGCSEDEYDGVGCVECGYCGKRALSWPNPVYLAPLESIQSELSRGAS